MITLYRLDGMLFWDESPEIVVKDVGPEDWQGKKFTEAILDDEGYTELETIEVNIKNFYSVEELDLSVYQDMVYFLQDQISGVYITKMGSEDLILYQRMTRALSALYDIVEKITLGE